jgi:hypothetical protein
MTATGPPSAVTAILGGACYPGPSCRSGMPPSDAIAQSLLGFPLDRVAVACRFASDPARIPLSDAQGRDVTVVDLV